MVNKLLNSAFILSSENKNKQKKLPY